MRTILLCKQNELATSLKPNFHLGLPRRVGLWDDQGPGSVSAREGFLSGKLGWKLAKRPQKEDVQTEHKALGAVSVW